MLPLVSISCVTYNQAPYIKECLDSFLMQQTDFAFEILINDDASTDGTREIIEEYASKYPEIIFPLYQSENQYSKGVRGMMAKFNFPRSRGKYIALCEGDDYWTDPLKLQKQVNTLEENSAYSMCFHDAWVVKDNMQSHKYVDKNKTVFTTEDLFERHFIPTASILFRNNIVFPDWYSKIQSGDKLLLFLFSLNGDIKFLNEPMSVYRLHSAGISNTHVGIKKVYDTALLLHLIDEETNYAYTKYCHSSLLYEIETHLLSDQTKSESTSISIKEIKVKLLIKEIIRRVYKRFKMINP